MIVQMAVLDRAFARAREDLRDVGLLDDGKYLDRIDCERHLMPAGLWNEMGCHYHDPGMFRWLGYAPGVIYIPINSPTEARRHGHTLADVVRHEFAHAWHWLDRKHVGAAWFRDAFGGHYDHEWRVRPEFDRADFASEYATTSPSEDFAETFMLFLKHRRDLDRFTSRRGFRAKLRAVERTVLSAARDRTPAESLQDTSCSPSTLSNA